MSILEHATPTLPSRLWSRYLEQPNGCWTWQGALGKDGYGRIGVGGRRGRIALVHRVAYELSLGAIPSGLHIDHLCRNRACINPDHLEAVTQRENTRRGMTPSAVSHRTDRCKRDHPLTANAYLKPDGQRQCRLCIQLRQNKSHAA